MFFMPHTHTHPHIRTQFQYIRRMLRTWPSDPMRNIFLYVSFTNIYISGEQKKQSKAEKKIKKKKYHISQKAALKNNTQNSKSKVMLF